MASFLARKIWKRMRKRENKNYHYVSFQPDEQQKIPKKQQKNSKKIQKNKNTVTYTFQAKIGLKKMRKRENKNYHFVPFLPNAKLKIPKKQQ